MWDWSVVLIGMSFLWTVCCLVGSGLIVVESLLVWFRRILKVLAGSGAGKMRTTAVRTRWGVGGAICKFVITTTLQTTDLTGAVCGGVTKLLAVEALEYCSNRFNFEQAETDSHLTAEELCISCFVFYVCFD